MATQRFVQGDCLSVLSHSFGAGEVDVVVTSPPYNLGIEYRSGFDDSMPRGHYLDYINARLREIHRVLSDSGSFFLNVGGKPTDPLVPYQVLGVATNLAGFKLQNVLHWVKSISIDGAPAVGHAKPINSKRFLTDCAELVFHLTKNGDVELDKLAIGVPFADKSNLGRDGRGKNGDLRSAGNCLFVPYETIKSRDADRPHPATFPVKLAEMLFKLHGVSRTKLTLDPFSGLGSSARAAKRLGLDHVGIELSAEDIRDAERLLAEDA